MKFVVLGFMLVLTACQRNKSDDKPVPERPIAQTSDFFKDGCLNIQTLQQLLSENSNAQPALQVTTQFQVISAVPEKKRLFYTHSAFDLKEITTHQIQFLVEPIQTGCLEVTSQTSSNEPLVYEITKSDPKSITLKLQKNEKKYQVFELELTMIAPMQIRSISRYKNLDIQCRGSEDLTFEVQQDFFWSTLPSEFLLDPLFLTDYLSSIDLAVEPEVPFQQISFDRMIQLKNQPVKVEVSLCP